MKAKTTVYNKDGSVREVRDATLAEQGELFLARLDAYTLLKKREKESKK